MTQNETKKKPVFTFKHPFFIVLGGIFIIYMGYRFGVWLYEMFK